MSGRTGRSTRRLLAPGTIFSPSLHSASLCAFLSLFLGRLFFFLLFKSHNGRKAAEAQVYTVHFKPYWRDEIP